MKSLFLLTVIVLIFSSCSRNNEKKLFKKVEAKFSNIHFSNDLENNTKNNILTYLYYYNGAGVAAGDFNNDGLVDLYFTSNENQDKLYINRGELKFQEISATAGIKNDDGWTTGVTTVDINYDGLLDIYICKVGNYNSFHGNNLLYINLGPNPEGIPTFKESAKEYGLNFSGFSTQASFIDYDLDGDLDVYLMNHSVHPNRTYGKGIQRNEFDSLSGDRFYENINGKYIDISKKVNIFQGRIGYGLGIAVSDINNDRYPDIYIGNDFFENDYFYLNQRNGTYKEMISSDSNFFGHTTHYSMGNDIADINNDGFMDLISLDMLPKDLKTYKTSGQEYSFPTYMNFLKNGFSPQYMQNTLHLNLGNGYFSEIGNLSEISATEWSWSALIADYDGDGLKDIFVSNGIKGASNDMDYINYIVNDSIQKKIEKGLDKEDMDFLQRMPEKKIPNFFFQNNGDLSFTDKSAEWLIQENTFSHGAVYCDLDNDGDLDIAINNVNQMVTLLENTSNPKHFIKLKFLGNDKNINGIGSKIWAFTKNKTIIQENFINRGYLSSIAPQISINLGKDSIIDSLKVLWPSGKTQLIKSIKTNQTLSVKEQDAKPGPMNSTTKLANIFSNSKQNFISFVHKEQQTLEFSRNPLVPFTTTNNGPEVIVVDFNKDGNQDIFISGAKGQPSALFSQDSLGKFQSVQSDLFQKDAINEDISGTFFDSDNDGDLDLVVVSGGNEFQNGKPLEPRLYLNENGSFQKSDNAFKNIAVNASKVIPIDVDNDGNEDLSLFSDQIPWQFGKTPKQWILKNDGKGNFKDITDSISDDFSSIGNTKDAVWIDLDNNNFKDLIVVGHWMTPTVFMNHNGRLSQRNVKGLDNHEGWWNVIKMVDLNNDGHLDFIAGNWGNNTKFKATEKEPIKLYLNDFDENGTLDPIVTFFYDGIETPFASRDELYKQLPFLNKKYQFYKDFANANIVDLFGKESLDKADKKIVKELKSAVFLNDGQNNFEIHYLPKIAQSSSVHDILVFDFNSDGLQDLFLVGNDFQISTQLGRLDASHGIALTNLGNGTFKWQPTKISINGAARKIESIMINGQKHVIIGINDDSPIILKYDNE